MEGKFIVIEGPDGSGSTTQVSLLEDYLKSKLRKVLVTKEPTNNLVGGLIRGVLIGVWELDDYGKQLLYCVDRVHHLQIEIEPTLKKGWDVITDRYIPSTLVYGASTFIKEEQYINTGIDYWDLFMKINKSFRVPDLTVILNLDPAECVRRISENRPSTEFFEHENILRNVVKDYNRFAREYPNVVLVDANGTINEVHSKIVKNIEDKLFPEEDYKKYDIPF